MSQQPKVGNFHWWLLAMAVVAAVLGYWPGLHGPFLLDDDANLRSLSEWLDDKLGLHTLVFERGAGVLGRPISMASFAFNAWLGGYAPFPLKLGNLIVHLLCGGAIFGFLRLLLRRDQTLAPRASLYAACVAALWLLHPLHASTVLYVVQRMAQLSTLFVLLGLWLYVLLRIRLQRGPSPGAAVGLLAGLPAMTAAAFLAKENGILLLPLCAVVELAYFRGQQRPRSVRAFHAVYVLAPLALGIVGFALKPARILGGYAGRDFGFMERMLSQPRALCDYIYKLLLPNPPRMGVYTDDFATSTGLLSPPTTLAALLVLLLVTWAAWHWRKRLPALFFGWTFFLVAHALEAGPIPLELYFEHRNYLPSVGLLTAAVGLAVAAGERLARAGLRPGRIGAVLLIGSLAVLAFGTHGRAQVWQSSSLIAESALLAHPHSLRANVAVMTSALRRGDRPRANEAITRLLAADSPRTRALAHAYRLMVECEYDGRSRHADLEAFAEGAALPLTIAEAQPFQHLYLITGQRRCPPLTDQDFGLAATQLVERSRATAPDHIDNWRVRYQAAAFLLRSGDAAGARAQALRAWELGADPPVAATLIMAQLRAGDRAGAQNTLDELTTRSDPTNRREQAFIDSLRAQVTASAGEPTKPAYEGADSPH